MRLRRKFAAATVGALLGPVLVGTSMVPAAAETISTRVDDGDPTLSAIAVSKLRFPNPAGAPPAFVVLSRDDVFADSLSGSSLLGKAPLLLTSTARLSTPTRDELQRLRAGAAGRRAYILGGINAVSAAVEASVKGLGYQVVRLAGTDRIATSIAIADQAFRLSGAKDVLLARAVGKSGSPGSGWVDSVAGGARAANNTLPVLLTNTAGLDARVAQWMRARGIARTHLLGGPGALSDAVFKAAPGARRHAGTERTATAAAIARGLWGAKDTGPRAFTIINGSQDRGWAFGLAAAGLAADRDAPVLLTMETVTAATRQLVSTCGTPQVELTIVGDGTLVSGAVREYLDDLDGEGCGPRRTLTRKAALSRFDDCTETLEWYRTNAGERVTAWGLSDWYGGFGPPVAAEGGGPAAAPEAGGDASGDGGGQDVSGTNVQEAGVDEPDVMKTDGRMLAVVANDGSVDLIDLRGATPRVAANIPSPTTWGLTELLLTGDVLTLLTTNQNFFFLGASDAAFAPGQWAPQTTTVSRWNIGVIDAPVELSSWEIDGSYRSARMIDGVARIVLESGPHDLDFTYPQDDSDAEHDRALEHNRQVVRDSTLENWLPSWGAPGDGGDGELAVACSAVHEPPVWSGFDAVTVVTYDTRTQSEPGAAASVIAQGQDVYASTDRLLVTTGRWGEAFEDEQLDSAVSTEVHAFDISNPATVSYTGSGRVNGYLLNQFSMSESGGFIRIAATTEPPWRCCEEAPQGQTSSFVAVLAERDGSLVEVGRVGGLGEGERIQSVRFLGDLGVVVTFRQIDPLYLIDLSNPSAPVVTGELKDTGFSQYLHRVGEDLLMGVGVAADEEGVTTGGQVALYDISNRAVPTLRTKVTFKDSWSPVGWDHHAFLFWEATGDAFVPFSTYSEQYREFASVLRVNAGASPPMAKRGELNHQGQAGQPEPSPIRRTFILGSNVYSLSWAGLARHDLATLTTTAWTPLPQHDGGGGGGVPLPVEGTVDPVA